MTARWWSQRFAAEGGAAAEGISKQLGRPALDPLTVLVRESAQNSWDARLEGPVEFTIEIRRLGDVAEEWRRLLLPGPSDVSAIALDAALQPDRYIIRIGDRNTRGLGGPLRADERAEPGTVANFVQFLRNVGEPSDQAGGGGTYGFGKGSLYAVSTARTIVVDSHCADGGDALRRLMGSSLGHSYYEGDVRYTGRHWWGDVHDDVPDPLLNEHAGDTARRLGLPGFEDGRTGTDIIIVGAQLGRLVIDDADVDRTSAEASTFIMSALLWNLWPKFGSDERDPGMVFKVVLDGRELEIPDPRSEPYLAGFVRSLDKLHRGEGIAYTRSAPPKVAGALAYEMTPADPLGNRALRAAVSEAMPFQPPFHHVARMRAAELVVDYFDGPVPADAMFGYAGVFRGDADPLAERAYAASEPPTHDDWVERGLQGTDAGVVRNARKFIRDTLAAEFAPRAAQSGDAVSGLGALAADLAGLIPATSGNAPSGPERPDRPPGPGPSGKRQPHVKGDPRVVMHVGTPHVVARVVVPPGASRRRILASPSVVLDGGGTETQPPLGASVPRIIGWRRERDGWEASGDAVEVPAEEDGDWFVYATFVPDAVIRISLGTEELA